MVLIWKLICLGGAGLSLSAALMSLAAQGGRFSERLDVLTHFAPIYALAALGALALAMLQGARVRIVLVGSGVIGLLSAISLMAPEALAGQPGPQAGPSAAGQIKIIQFNAWGGNARKADALKWLLAQDADVIFLQESGSLRDPLVRSGGYTATCSHCASQILTRGVPIETYAPPRIERDKVFLTTATLRDGTGRFTVVGVHRHWPTRFEQSRKQSAQLRALLGSYEQDRLIVAGDFNSTPWSFARRHEDVSLGLVRRTRFMPTWPAERVSHNRLPALFPYLPIDHVYAGLGWATVSVMRGPKLGSDHYPVVVILAPTSP
jgi:endonuclease/exonuclease/phosphatase (EEP) superfamily protein YafD